MADYLVQEDGTSKFLLENGTGALLLESSGTVFASEEDGDWWASNACFAVVAASLALFPINNRGTRWIYPQNTAPTCLDELHPAPVATQQQWPAPPLQATTDDEVVVTASVAFQPDEDYYVIQVQQQWLLAQPVTDDYVIVPQPVTFQPDEDFWFSPAPWPAILNVPAPWIDEQTPSLYGVPDELFYQPPPQQQWLYAQPFRDDETIAFPLAPDEFFYQPPAQIQWSYAQPITDDEIIAPQPATLTVDEFFYFPLQMGTFWTFVPQQWSFETIEWPTPPPPPTIPNISILRWGLGSRITPPYNP